MKVELFMRRIILTLLVFVGFAGNSMAFEIENDAIIKGGAVYISDTVSTFGDVDKVDITKVALTYNVTSGSGGVAYVKGTSKVVFANDTVFSYNGAGESGGAIFFGEDADVSVAGEGFLSYNSATLDGGAMFFDKCSKVYFDENSDMSMSFNNGVNGGAIGFKGGDEVELAGLLTLTSNRASASGGGLSIIDVTLVNFTGGELDELGLVSEWGIEATSNYSHFGGGVYAGAIEHDATTPMNVHLSGSIKADNNLVEIYNNFTGGGGIAFSSGLEDEKIVSVINVNFEDGSITHATNNTATQMASFDTIHILHTIVIGGGGVLSVGREEASINTRFNSGSEMFLSNNRLNGFQSGVHGGGLAAIGLRSYDSFVMETNSVITSVGNVVDSTHSDWIGGGGGVSIFSQGRYVVTSERTDMSVSIAGTMYLGVDRNGTQNPNSTGSLDGAGLFFGQYYNFIDFTLTGEINAISNKGPGISIMGYSGNSTYSIGGVINANYNEKSGFGMVHTFTTFPEISLHGVINASYNKGDGVTLAFLIYDHHDTEVTISGKFNTRFNELDGLETYSSGVYRFTRESRIISIGNGEYGYNIGTWGDIGNNRVISDYHFHGEVYLGVDVDDSGNIISAEANKTAMRLYQGGNTNDSFRNVTFYPESYTYIEGDGVNSAIEGAAIRFSGRDQILNFEGNMEVSDYDVGFYAPGGWPAYDIFLNFASMGDKKVIFDNMRYVFYTQYSVWTFNFIGNIEAKNTDAVIFKGWHDFNNRRSCNGTGSANYIFANGSNVSFDSDIYICNDAGSVMLEIQNGSNLSVGGEIFAKPRTDGTVHILFNSLTSSSLSADEFDYGSIQCSFQGSEMSSEACEEAADFYDFD